MYEGEKCYGKLLATDAEKAYRTINGKLQLQYLIQAYQWYPDKTKFFNSFFEKLAGTGKLKEMIVKGMSEEEIRNSWQKDIATFKATRKKYLLYRDFE